MIEGVGSRLQDLGIQRFRFWPVFFRSPDFWGSTLLILHSVCYEIIKLENDASNGDLREICDAAGQDFLHSLQPVMLVAQ